MGMNRANRLSACLTIAIGAAFAGPPYRIRAQDSPEPGPVFGRDVAPVLVAQCLECHNGQRESSGLSMATFESLRAGGDAGSTWVVPNSTESLIVRKLRGLDPPRMPRNRPSLNAETIDRIAAWIDAGAKLEEGRRADETLGALAWSQSRIAADRLGRMSPEGRLSEAEGEARRIFAAVRPDSAVVDAKTTRSSDRFVVIGIENAGIAVSLLENLEKVAGELSDLFGPRLRVVSFEAPRFLAFVFEKPAEFAEFCRQNGFETPQGSRTVVGRSEAAWPILGVLVSHDGLVASEVTAPSGALRKPARSGRRATADESRGSSTRSVHSLAVEALVESIFDAFPKAPAWLETGLALAMARSYDANDTPFENMIVEARASGPARVTGDWPRRADEFLKDRTAPAVSRPLAFALIDWLRRRWPGEFSRFVRAVAEGEQELDNTLRTLWNTDRATFVAAWTDSLLRGPDRKGRR